MQCLPRVNSTGLAFRAATAHQSQSKVFYASRRTTNLEIRFQNVRNRLSSCMLRSVQVLFTTVFTAPRCIFVLAATPDRNFKTTSEMLVLPRRCFFTLFILPIFLASLFFKAQKEYIYIYPCIYNGVRG